MSTTLTKGGNFRSTESIIMLLIDELINNKIVFQSISKTDTEIVLSLMSENDAANRLSKLFISISESADE